MKRITHLATQIENALQQILEHDTDALARETGFVQRQRKLIPTAWAKFMKTSATENPLLKVPPAGRGNRVDARLGSPREAGGTCRRGAIMNSGSVIGIIGWRVPSFL